MDRRHHIGLPTLSALAIFGALVVAASAAQQPAAPPRGPEPAAAAPRSAAPTLRPPSSPVKAPDAAGFLQRWLVLEPIRVAGQLTDSAVQGVVKTEHFP